MPPERHIGTMHSVHFTPLSWQINSTFSIHSYTDRSESLPLKSGISLGLKFNDIAKIACKQNEDIWVQHWCHVSRRNKTKISVSFCLCLLLLLCHLLILLNHRYRCWLAHSSTPKIRWIVRICDVEDRFLQKPFWIFLRIFSISGSIQLSSRVL